MVAALAAQHNLACTYCWTCVHSQCSTWACATSEACAVAAVLQMSNGTTHITSSTSRFSRSLCACWMHHNCSSTCLVAASQALAAPAQMCTCAALLLACLTRGCHRSRPLLNVWWRRLALTGKSVVETAKCTRVRCCTTHTVRSELSVAAEGFVHSANCQMRLTAICCCIYVTLNTVACPDCMLVPAGTRRCYET